MTHPWIWPWGVLIVGLGLVLLVAIVVVVLRAARAREPMIPASAVAGVAGTAGAAVAALPSVESVATSIALRASFLKARRELRRLAPRAADRLRAPYVLLMGEVGSGKSGVARALPLDRLGAAPTADDEAAACVWHFFERSVVLDLTGVVVLDPATGQGDARGWKTLVRLLQQQRPERPLDAIVLTIPAEDLVGPRRLSDHGVIEKAALIEARLSQLQRGLGLRLPVYVLVTKCDRIPGFSPFCRSLGDDRGEQMLGWSSPYVADAAFSAGWVDEAFGVVLQAMQDAEFDALARREPLASAGDFLLLPPRLSAAAPTLRELLGRVFRSTAYDQGAILRGIYFTGDPARAEPEPEAMPGSATAPAGPAATAAGAASAAHRPFLRDLFERKIFAEYGFVRTGARVFPSRHRTIRALQVATLAIVLLGPIGLWWGASGVRIGPWRLTPGLASESQSLLALLRTVESEVQRMNPSGGAQTASVFPLLSAMAGVNSSHFGSVLLPTSVLTPLHTSIERSIEASFQRVLFPDFRRSLCARIGALVGEAPSAVTGCAAAGQGLDTLAVSAMSLPAYLDALHALGENVDAYDRLVAAGGGSTHELADLVHYLYGEDVAPGFFVNDEYYRRALAQTTGPVLRPGPRENGLALQRAGAITRQAYALIVSRLTEPGTDTMGDSASTDSVDAAKRRDAASADVNAIVALRAFLDPEGPVQAALLAIRPPFAFGDAFAIRVRDTLSVYTSRLTGQIGQYADGTHGRLAMRRALDVLLRQPFMQAPVGREIPVSVPPGTMLRWDATRLDQAIALYTNYATFLEHGLDSLPDALRTPLLRLTTSQVGAAMSDAVTDAMRAEPGYTMGYRTPDRVLRDEVSSFEESAPRLEHLLELLDAVQATDSYDALDELTGEQAADLLAQLDSTYRLSQRLVLPSSVLDAWDGQPPFSQMAFGGRRSGLVDYLSSEIGALQSAAAQASAVVSFLQTRAAAGSPTPPSLPDWADLITAAQQLGAKPPMGPLASLEATLPTQLDSIDVSDCRGPAPRRAAGTDILSRRVDEMRAAVWARCERVSLREARAAYARMNTVFRERLAGRFPFAPPDAEADASPEAVLDFLHAYQVVAPSAGDLVDAAGMQGPRLRAFFADLAAMRKFLAPLLDSATSRPPTYDYAWEFRVERDREQAANQIAGWTADVGAQHASIEMPAAGRRGRWHADDSVRVTLRWATGSPYRPVRVDGGGAVVRGESATLAFGGEWSLLRLLRAYQAERPDPLGAQLLRVVVRTAQRAAPGLGESITRAYLRVRLFDPDTKAELVMPRFPLAVPPLTMEGAR
jgi:type VI secretion system protein ImpL